MTTQPTCSTCGKPTALEQRTWLNLDQAADYSTLSRRTLEEYVAAEVLPAVKTGAPGSRGGRRVIRRADLDQFLADRITSSNVRRLQRRRRTA